MSDLNEIEGRIFSALGRIRAVVEDSNSVGAQEMPLLEKLKSYDQLNAELGEEVVNLREKREKDVRELDTLLSELKPLIQEVS